ncbi:MAG: SMI1/KNR4 family protein [Candidatus Zixiibacteriota bacterium]
MLSGFHRRNSPVDSEQIKVIEDRFGVLFPESYRKFLLAFNGGEPVEGLFPIDGFENNPDDLIQAFFGVRVTEPTEDLSEILLMLEGLTPSGFIPIARTAGDDFVCLDLRKEGYPVVYWDRRPFWGNNIWREEYLYPVADNFEDLLAKLQESPY